MKNDIAILAAVFSIAATAAPVPQATHLWTTNKINEIVGTNTAAKITSATNATLTAANAYADAAIQRDVPNWARQRNPPESMTDNAVVLTNNALKTKGGSAVTADHVGAAKKTSGLVHVQGEIGKTITINSTQRWGADYAHNANIAETASSSSKLKSGNLTVKYHNGYGNEGAGWYLWNETSSTGHRIADKTDIKVKSARASFQCNSTDFRDSA